MMEKISNIKKRLSFLDPFTYVDRFVIPRVHELGGAGQWAVFVASYVILLILVSMVLGATPLFLLLLTMLYAYLYFFERKEAVDWGVYLLSAFVFAWAIYAFFGLMLGTQSPFVIVVSGSMEPLYHRGDVIVLQGQSFEQLQGKEVSLPESISGRALAVFAEPQYVPSQNGLQIESIKFNNGDEIEINKDGSIIVYFSELLQEPIIHRIVAKIGAADGKYVLTKGDSVNNSTVDQDCGKVVHGLPEKACIARYPVNEGEIQGAAVLQIPAIGCVKLWLFDDLSSLLLTGRLPSNFSGIC